MEFTPERLVHLGGGSLRDAVASYMNNTGMVYPSQGAFTPVRRPNARRPNVNQSQKRGRGIKTVLRNRSGAVTTRTKRKNKRKPKTSVIGRLKRRVGNLEDKVTEGVCHKIEKVQSSLRLDALQNQCVYGEITEGTNAQIKDRFDGIDIFDPATGLTNSDISGISANASVQLKTNIKAWVKNNSSVACHLRVYYVRCKKGFASASFITKISAGLSDQGVSNPLTNIQAYPTEASTGFSHVIKIDKTEKYYLTPGDELILGMGSNKFQEVGKDLLNATNDSLSEKDYAYAMIFRVHGDVAHLSGTKNAISFAEGAVDIIYQNTSNVRYIDSFSHNEFTTGQNLNADPNPIQWGADESAQPFA